MLDEPHLKEPYAKACLNNMNRGVSVFFLFELGFRCIARGFCRNKYAYLRDPFNVFDFLIIVCVTITLVPEYLYEVDPDKYDYLKYLAMAAKPVKCIRPLRLAKSSMLRGTVDSLAASLPHLGAAACINVLFIYVFSILGV
jgi:hypothetical protein